MRQALIIATKDQLIDEGHFQYFQHGNIVTVVSYNKGSDYAFCKTLDNSKSIAVQKSLIIAEDSFMKLSDKPKLSPVPRAYFGKVVCISKIISENTVKIQLPNGNNINANINELIHI